MSTSLFELALRGLTGAQARVVRQRESTPPKPARERKFAPIPLTPPVALPEWERVIPALLREGRWSKTKLAEALGVTHKNISAMIRGEAEPTYAQGVKLLALRAYIDRHGKKG
jgi:hypothetical protein